MKKTKISAAKKLVLVAALAVTIPCIPAYAEAFKGSEFLKWERDNQEFYMRTSIGMAILIADQNDKAHGKCVNDWFSKDEQGAYNYILENMRRFPEFHPRGTILAAMEKQCGEFTYKK